MQVNFVVLVLPRRAAAVTAILGDGNQMTAALFLAIVALHQFGVPGSLAPVALDAGAGIAQRHLLQFILPVQVLGHGALSCASNPNRPVLRSNADSEGYQKPSATCSRACS